MSKLAVNAYELQYRPTGRSVYT